MYFDTRLSAIRRVSAPVACGNTAQETFHWNVSVTLGDPMRCAHTDRGFGYLRYAAQLDLSIHFRYSIPAQFGRVCMQEIIT